LYAKVINRDFLCAKERKEEKRRKEEKEREKKKRKGK
jgi:hypothetical protein